MLFRQLFEPLSSTYTYLLGCEATGQAVLIDPVIVTIDRDLQAVQDLGLRLACSIETHVHADHITAALELQKKCGSRIATPANEQVACADLQLEEGREFHIGSIRLLPLHTPGHTAGHFCYRLDGSVLGSVVGSVFTGDALLIDGCGRTDFQQGNADSLYRSVHEKLFTLPGETLVYPAHDYAGRFVSSIAQEKKRNPRLGGTRTLDEFRKIMAGLKLPYPAFIDYAVPGNKQCGTCGCDVPDKLQQYCRHMTESRQG
jgi:sulfur dioxygenase